MSSGPPPVPGGRSPEDREAARRERDARRAARQGGEAPASPARQETDWMAEAERLTEVRDAPELGPPPDVGGFDDAGDGRRAVRDRRGSRSGRYVAMLGLMVVVFGVAWFLLTLFQPFKSDGEGAVRVVIPQGSSLGQIADLLEQKSVISNSTFFQLRARLAGRSGDLKPGSYAMRRDMSFVAALDALERGVPPNVVRVSVPEGRSRKEIARSLKGVKLRGNYLRATVRSPALNPRRYGARNARNLEGFLFPATYELKKGTSIKRLVREQLDTFKAKFATVNLRYARSKNLTPYDVLIIASMVEREAQVARERPLVASVIYNRLKQGMPLGIDATIRFALDQWEAPLRQSELATQSPYNTRLPGTALPPGPIGNPGLSAIKAAAHPARSKFLFYVVKPGTCGEHAFSATDAEFQQDVARYNSERAKRGGKSPDTC